MVVVELQKLQGVVGRVVKVILLLLQEQTKFSVQEALLVQEIVLLSKVELAQEIVVRLVLPAYRTVGVAVVPKMNLHHVQMLEVVAVELWLLVMILQILCLYRGLEVILLLLQEIIGVINLQTLVATPFLYTRQVAVMC